MTRALKSLVINFTYFILMTRAGASVHLWVRSLFFSLKRTQNDNICFLLIDKFTLSCVSSPFFRFNHRAPKHDVAEFKSSNVFYCRPYVLHPKIFRQNHLTYNLRYFKKF